MGLDTKTYCLTERQSQCDFDFDFDLRRDQVIEVIEAE
jgi:DNA polymerase III alpha subunit